MRKLRVLLTPAFMAACAVTVNAADGIDEIAGKYVWTYDLEITDNAGRRNGTLEITPIEGTADRVEIRGIYPAANVTLEGVYDAGQRKLSIAKQVAFESDTYGTVYFSLGTRGESAEIKVPLDEPIEAAFDGRQFTFRELDLMLIGREETGWFLAADYNKWRKLDTDDGAWRSVGMARFQDGWISPKFGIDQTANIYDVPLLQNVENSNRYRLFNPYSPDLGSAVSEYNLGTGDGYIEFDVSDPEHVLFTPLECGFADMQSSEYYLYNTLAYGCYLLDADLETLLSTMGETITSTKFRDGVVELVAGDACFGIVGNIWGGYKWNGNDGKRLDMTARIFMPDDAAVETVDAEEVASQRRCYNLQGVPVAHPQTGTPVIVVEGKRIYKMIVR